jgi:predicted MPP superfamily phosphohydrolase
MPPRSPTSAATKPKRLSPVSDLQSLSRRKFLATGAAVLAAGALPLAQVEASDRVRLADLRVPVPGLPTVLDGVRIAQVTDLHLYDGVHAAARQALEVLDRARPDLLLLTGDQWDRPAGARALASWTRELRPECQVIAVLGNHEYSSGFTPARAERMHGAAGVRLLVNEVAVVSVRQGALSVLGLDDFRHGRGDPAAALDRAAAGLPQIWMHHEPQQLDATSWPADARVALAVGGHTHGGQIRMPGMPVWTPKGSGRYLAGWYGSPIGSYYVSRGVGTSGVRMRFRCPAELPVFTLRAV